MLNFDFERFRQLMATPFVYFHNYLAEKPRRSLTGFAIYTAASFLLLDASVWKFAERPVFATFVFLLVVIFGAIFFYFGSLFGIRFVLRGAGIRLPEKPDTSCVMRLGRGDDE